LQTNKYNAFQASFYSKNARIIQNDMIALHT